MSPWRTKRQLVIFLIITAPFAMAAFFIIKSLIPVPICFDNKQNSNETGIDCGGSCISCEFKYPKPIKIFWAHVVPVHENLYDVAAEIENPNESLSSVDVEYEFMLYDQFGPVIKRTGKTFLYAQERMLIIQAGISTTRFANRAEFRIVNVRWQNKGDPAPTIIAEKRVYSVAENRGQKQSVVEMTLFNKSPYDFMRMEIQVAVLDQEQNLLGVNTIEAENVRSQSRHVIRSIWPRELAGNVHTITIQPRVNIFDPHVIIKPQ